MSQKVALEISKQYLKVVTASRQGTKISITDFIIEPIINLTDDQISQKIIDIFKRKRIKNNSVFLCLSRDSSTVRNIHLPSKSQDEISQMIDLHIARVVPYKRDEIVYAYQSLGNDEMGYARLILAIVHKDIIRRQEKILEQASLYVDHVSLSSYGIWLWAIKTCSTKIKQDELYILLDFDSTFTDFIVFSNKYLYLTRGIATGAKAIQETKEVALIKLLGEVKQSLIIFYKEEMNRKIAKVFVSGATISDSLKALLLKEFDVDVEDVPEVLPEQLLKDRRLMMPADISMTGISDLIVEDENKVVSFVLPEMQIRKSVRDKARELLILGCLVTYLLVSVFIIFLGRFYNQYSYLKKLNQQLTSMGTETTNLIESLRKVDFIKGFCFNRKAPFLVMSQMQNLIIPEVALSYVNIDSLNGEITLRGQAAQLSDAFKFINSLERFKNFKDVETKYTRKKKFKDREVTDFEVSVKLALNT